jgi:exosortase A
VPRDLAVSVARAQGWRHGLIAMAVALCALAFVMHDAAARLWDLWTNNAGYGHGFLIVPVALYLLWLRRERLAAQMPAPDLRGLAATAALMLLWGASRALGIVLGEQLALVFMLATLTWTMLGPRVARRVLLPVLYLLCAVPVWSYLRPILQDNTAVASASIVRALGIPIYLEGLYMTIPDGVFVVADVCAGLRYLLAAVALGGFLLNLRTLWAQCTLVAITFVLGVVFNWVRVVGIVMIGHYSQMQSPYVREHIGFGWAMFVIVVVLTIVAGRVLERLESPPATDDGHAETEGAPVPSVRRFSVAALLSALVLLIPAAGMARLLEAPVSAPVLAAPALAAGSGWSPVEGPVDEWRPVYFGAAAERLLRFRRDGVEVDLFVAYYPVQRQDAEVVNDNNSPFDGEVWERHGLRVVPDQVLMGSDIPASEFLVHREGFAGERTIWRTWWIDGRFTTDAVQAKLWQISGLLSGRPEAAAILISVESPDPRTPAAEHLQSFMQAAQDGVRAMLDDARQP